MKEFVFRVPMFFVRGSKMFRECRRVFQRVRRIIAMLLRFLRCYKKKSELALYSPSTNNALNVGASQAGTCPLFAS
jgi:hypothetical protein